MAPINPIIITIIGAVVTVISLFTPHMQFFIYVGIAFFVYGIVRLYILGIKRERDRKNRIQHYHTKPTMPSQVQKCPRCHVLIRPYDNFCSRCGQILRRQ